MAYDKVKPQAGTCTPSSGCSRWAPRADVKLAARKRRRRADRAEVARGAQ